MGLILAISKSAASFNLTFFMYSDFFVESKTMKDNVDKFLSNLLMVPLTEKLSYRNTEIYYKVYWITNGLIISLNFNMV